VGEADVEQDSISIFSSSSSLSPSSSFNDTML
jgi:hypothetical protein